MLLSFQDQLSSFQTSHLLSQVLTQERELSLNPVEYSQYIDCERSEMCHLNELQDLVKFNNIPMLADLHHAANLSANTLSTSQPFQKFRSYTRNRYGDPVDGVVSGRDIVLLFLITRELIFPFTKGSPSPNFNTLW